MHNVVAVLQNHCQKQELYDGISTQLFKGKEEIGVVAIVRTEN